jgi:hypothetical protein
LTFPGATLVETQTIPPDTMGAVGPSQFVIAATGRIRSFAKSTGTADGVLNVTTNAFFATVRGTANTFSPRIRYDRLSSRWFITIITDSLPGKLLVASSNGAIALGIHGVELLLVRRHVSGRHVHSMR